MAWNFSTACKDARANAITTTVGTGGKVKIYTSAFGTLLATWTFTGNMFGSSSGAIITMNAPAAATVTGAATGTAALARLTTSADVTVIDNMTVGTSGTDVIIDNTSIASGQNVTLNYASCTITEAA